MKHYFWGASLVLLAGLAPMVRAQQPIAVHQAEAFLGAGYAPIDFAGTTPQNNWGASPYIGLNFIALDHPGTASTTYSSHADGVGQSFYGSATNSYALGAVKDVYNDSADNFLTNTNFELSPGPGALPFFFGRSLSGANGISTVGIKVSNHSYVGTVAGQNVGTQQNPIIASSATDDDMVRRIDFMINRENVVFCAGAVTDDFDTNSIYYKANLVWTARNSVAVWGDFSSTPMNPNSLSGVGKRHADVWGSGVPSFATGRASGYSAALIRTAQTANMLNGDQDEVIRSILMTGANKSVASSLYGAWTANTPGNNLNKAMGAGQLDYNKSLSILNAGSRPVGSVSVGTITGATASSAAQGWAYGQSVVAGQRAIVIQVLGNQQINQLTATLNWDVTYPTLSPTTLDTADLSLFEDLDLQFASVTQSGSNYIIGSIFAQSGLKSIATMDNVEHLFYQGQITPGYYAFLISEKLLNEAGTTATPVDFGFSYDLQLGALVPEPTACAVLLCGLALLMNRRGKHPSTQS